MRFRAVLAAAALGAAALAPALLDSCSSAPKPSDTVTTMKLQADRDTASGNGYYRQWRYSLALQFFSQALSEYTSVDDGEGVARSYAAVGRCYMALGSLEEAEAVLLRARERARRDSPALMFDTSSSLAELYLARGDAARARAILQELQAAPPGSPLSPGGPSQIARLYHDLGTAEKNLGDHGAALKSLDRSLNTNLAGKRYAEAASDYYMIASVYSLQANYDEAMKNAELALYYDKRVESSPGITKDLYALGVIASRRGDEGSAFDYFQRSYLVATTLSLKDDMRRALSGLVSAAQALGRASDAEAYRKALADLGPS